MGKIFSGQEIYTFLDDSKGLCSLETLQGLKFINSYSGNGKIIKIRGDIDDGEISVSFENSKFNREIVSYGKFGRIIPAKALKEGYFEQIFIS